MSNILLVKQSVALAALVAFAFSARIGAARAFYASAALGPAAGARDDICGYWCALPPTAQTPADPPADPPSDPASQCGYWCLIAPAH